MGVVWKKLLNWLRNLYSESNIIMVITLKGMGYSRIVEKVNTCTFLGNGM